MQTLFAISTVKLWSRFASLMLARLGQSMQSLPEALKEWVSQRAPMLVPIPIRAAPRTRGPISRHQYP